MSDFVRPILLTGVIELWMAIVLSLVVGMTGCAIYALISINCANSPQWLRTQMPLGASESLEN